MLWLVQWRGVRERRIGPTDGPADRRISGCSSHNTHTFVRTSSQQHQRHRAMNTHPVMPRPGTILESSTMTMNFLAHTCKDDDE